MALTDFATDTQTLRVAQRKPALSTREFWVFQLTSWAGLTVLWYFSLTIWYNPGELAPAIHTMVQSILGFAISHPLRWLANASWHKSLARRALINGAGVVVAALVWTWARTATFETITGSDIPAGDLGGWINASVVVMLAWSFGYHTLSYSRQSHAHGLLANQAESAAQRARATAEAETIKRLEAEKLFRETQLRMLKYQLNPHFFLNALNSVSALVQRGDKPGATDMLARIGDFLRVSLAHPEEYQHTLDEELDALDLYLGIETVRFGDRLRTVFDVDEAARDVIIPSLLLQPLFENAIKFAVTQRLTPTTIAFSAKLMGQRLELRIADDGPGMAITPYSRGDGPKCEVRGRHGNGHGNGQGNDQGNDQGNGQGIGLVNVRQRLESAYGNHFTLTLSDNTPTGFVAHIIIDAPRHDR